MGHESKILPMNFSNKAFCIIEPSWWRSTLLCQLIQKGMFCLTLTIIYHIDPRLGVAILYATLATAMPSNMLITLGTRSLIPVALECVPGGSNNKV